MSLLLLTSLALADPAIEAALQADPGQLTVALDDMHPLHGGDRYALAADGALEHVEKVRGQETARTVAVPAADRRALQALLLDLQAWQQQVPATTPLPDQMATRLTLTAGETSIETWEWHNDLAANDRLIQVVRWFEAQTSETQTGEAP